MGTEVFKFCGVGDMSAGCRDQVREKDEQDSTLLVGVVVSVRYSRDDREEEDIEFW